WNQSRKADSGKLLSQSDQVHGAKSRPVSRYRFSLSARTQVGSGEAVTEESPAPPNEATPTAAPPTSPPTTVGAPGTVSSTDATATAAATEATTVPTVPPVAPTTTATTEATATTASTATTTTTESPATTSRTEIQESGTAHRPCPCPSMRRPPQTGGGRLDSQAGGLEAQSTLPQLFGGSPPLRPRVLSSDPCFLTGLQPHRQALQGPHGRAASSYILRDRLRAEHCRGGEEGRRGAGRWPAGLRRPPVLAVLP
uniref:Uncharacterized protein n=1 Tax=Bos mutus grunniens TaxID=30521 RepID=A0A8B9X7F9_BOSMU